MSQHDPWDWYAFQDVGRDRLTSYLRQTFQTEETIRAMLVPFRDLEYLHHQLLDMLRIHQATGKGLDAFGELVKISRLGRDDDTYRLAILAKRFSSGGSGTPEEVKRAIKNIAVGTSAKIIDHLPAAFIAQVRGDSAGLNSTLSGLVANMAAAGVRAYETHDYGKGGFILSGVSGRLFNALGIGPTASGLDDTILGVNGITANEPASGDIIAPGPGLTALTLNDVNNHSYKTAPQQAQIFLTVGQDWHGTISREDGDGVATTFKTPPSPVLITPTLVNGDVTFTALATGATAALVESDTGDTLFISIVVVASNSALGINSTYAAVGGTLLAGDSAATTPENSSFFGTYQDPVQ